MHHEDIERMTSDLLHFDSDNLADPMGWVHDEVTGGKWNLFRSHIRLSQSIRLVLRGRFSLTPHRATATVHDPTRSGNVSLHQRQDTVKSLFEASGQMYQLHKSDIGARSYPLWVPIRLASARIRGKILIPLVGHILPLICVSGIGLLTRDVGPYHRVFTVGF